MRLVRFALVTAVLSTVVYLCWLPDVRPLKRSNPRTTAYMRLYKGTPRQIWVKWDEISDNLKNAVLVAEDDGFYRHEGVDWDAMRAAFEKDVDQRRFAYGASTIT